MSNFNLQDTSLLELKNILIESLNSLSRKEDLFGNKYMIKICEELELCYEESLQSAIVPDSELYFYCIYMTLNLINNDLDRSLKYFWNNQNISY